MIPAPAALVAVFAGGAAGASARLGLFEALAADPGAWPWATFSANVAGSALLGYVSVRFGRPGLRPLSAGLGPGLCGALTTFSAVQIEILWMLDAGRGALAGAYLGASVAACLVAVSAASRIARRGLPA